MFSLTLEISVELVYLYVDSYNMSYYVCDIYSSSRFKDIYPSNQVKITRGFEGYLHLRPLHLWFYGSFLVSSAHAES